MNHPRRKRCPECGELYITTRRPYYSKHVYYIHTIHPTRYCKAVVEDTEPSVLDNLVRRPQWLQK